MVNGSATSSSVTPVARRRRCAKPSRGSPAPCGYHGPDRTGMGARRLVPRREVGSRRAGAAARGRPRAAPDWLKHRGDLHELFRAGAGKLVGAPQGSTTGDPRPRRLGRGPPRGPAGPERPGTKLVAVLLRHVRARDPGTRGALPIGPPGAARRPARPDRRHPRGAATPRDDRPARPPRRSPLRRRSWRGERSSAGPAAGAEVEKWAVQAPPRPAATGRKLPAEVLACSCKENADDRGSTSTA